MFRDDEVGAPLRQSLFRRIWLASLLSNFGSLIQGVGAAWAMTQMAASAELVALVQTAAMLPVMLISIPAGAIADMYDRRLVGLVALAMTFASSIALSVLAWFDMLTPISLLVFCFLIGSGMAMFGPAWQSSVNEQVPPKMLPAAITLNSISFNIARSFGPAIGGVIVAAAGAVAAFAANALAYIPILAVLYFWRRKQVPSRLPPERLDRAIISGVRYIVHSPAMRTALMRCTLTGALGGSIFALLPLLVRDVLDGGAQSYGAMLGAFGIGAILGAFYVSDMRGRFGSEASLRAALLAMGIGTGIAALSRIPALTALALALAGAGWMMSMALFNISIQMAAPRWVSGRALAGFRSSNSAGLAIGSWAWGYLAVHTSIDTAMLVSAVAMLASPLVAVWLRMPEVDAATQDASRPVVDPEVRLDLTPRSGPVVVEIEYRIAQSRARAFFEIMQQVQLNRQRNGAYGWSIARDVTDPELWTERYHCPTWYDYLRQRSRPTDAERALQKTASDMHIGPEPVRIRRMLERPFGSVRWKDDTPEVGAAANVIPIAAQTPSTSGT
ncbi:MFS transporter [Bradyrhizobium sp. LHD-71]|uniref:MFS transporter n=1 Tax=Bradyrhizobium sp. LHD-71 TaxID=3072141 RepID=UPI00280DB6C2|nr:MFS transporter [Bradyrhizobium sp. LHD-71]MDQ8731751.1 MFS transporter [Bradyrhizobium sp. LHD-71]